MISAFVLSIGMFFIVTSFIGILRFRSAYNKMHAISIFDSVGMPAIILWLIFFNRDDFGVLDVFKLSLSILFIYVITPLNSSCIALIKKDQDIRSRNE